VAVVKCRAISGFLDGHADEIAELDQFGFLFVTRANFPGPRSRQQLVFGSDTADAISRHFDSLLAAA